MALNLKEIQAKLLAQQANKDRARSGTGGGDNAVYPFWNNPDNTVATLRFLPDGDETNDFFWLERLIIKLSFPGVKGQNDGKPVEVQVPCNDMWKAGSCPITAEIRPWWKDKSLEDMARKYYRKKSYLFQGFVVDNPNKEDTTPENPIRRFIINPSIFDHIKKILLVEEIEHTPVDYDHGMDFFLAKSKQGQWANYDNSGWIRPGSLSPRARPLSENERGAVGAHGLWNLSQFMPKKPDDDHLKAIMELFTASVNEELYDMDRWGQYYRPNGMRAESSNSAGTASESVRKTESVAPIQQGSGVTASSILNRLSSSGGSSAPAAKETSSPPWEEPVQAAAPTESATKKIPTPQELINELRARNAARKA